jgi:hypothetical protein
MAIAIAIFAAVTVGILALVIALVWLAARGYDRHPWVRKFLNAEARTMPGYAPPDLPREYTDQIPGWDSKP